MIYCPLNKWVFTIWDWPCGYRAFQAVISALVKKGWLRRIKAVGDDFNIRGMQEWTPRPSHRFVAHLVSPLRQLPPLNLRCLDWFPPLVQVRKPKTKQLDVAFMAKNWRYIKKWIWPRINGLNESSKNHDYYLPRGDFDGWIRIYQGGLVGCGGRLVSGYMALSRDDRAMIMIDEQETVQIDVVACGLRILYALSDMEFAIGPDPYDIGLNLDREVVKAIVNHASGVGNLNSKSWPKLVIERYPDAKALPWRVGRDTLIAKLPALAILKRDVIDWSRIQFHESNIIIAAMEKCFEQGIGCLSVHDCLIVAKVNRDVAVQLFREAFIKELQLEPEFTFE